MRSQYTPKTATIQTGIWLLSIGEYVNAARIFYRVAKKPQVPFDMIRAEWWLLLTRDRFFRTPQSSADKAEINARCEMCRYR